MPPSQRFSNDGSWNYARYQCSTCYRPFDRKDVLMRHMHTHNSPRPPPGARRKACLSCAHSKTRCSGERPRCSSCQRRNLECVFEVPISSSHHEQRRRTEYRRNNRNGELASNEMPVDLPPSAPDSNSLRRAGLVGTPPPAEAQSTEPDHHQNQGDVNFASNAELDPHTGASFRPDVLFMPLDNPDFSPNLDWILEGSSSDDFPTDFDFLSTFTGHDDPASQHFFMSAQQTGPPAAAVKDDATDLDNGAVLDALLLTPQPQDTLDYGDPWPLESPQPPLKHISLPPLGSEQQGSSSHGRYFTLMRINDRTWHALQRCLQLPFEHSTRQSLNLDNFPSKENIDHCIDLYFAHFQPNLSFIHQPTFDPSKDLVVTLAMICIGVCYTDFVGAKAFSITLSELNRRLLVFMAEYDHRFVRTQSYLAAQLLQGTHGYCSGSERLFELSESRRSSLIHHAKCIGLFRPENEKSSPPEATIEETWQNYIRTESSRRLGWAVFMYDASVGYLHNNRPFLSCADVNLNLPGSVEHWEADSAEVWASLHPWSRNVPPTSDLQSKLGMLFDDNPDPTEKIHNEEHLFLIALTLLRMLWTFKEVKSFSASGLPTLRMYEEGRQTIVRAMDQMSVSIVAMTLDHTRSEMTHFVYRSQLVHMSHIYGAGDLMNWLFPYLRDDSGSRTVRIRMRRWADEDARRTREVAYHSAQVIGLIRHYPSHMPLQSFLIFHAGVVLSCMSLLLPEARPSYHEPLIQLDKLEADTGHSNRQKDWVIDGRKDNLSLVGVPTFCCPAARQQILNQTASLLKRQKTWGIAETLARVVISLGARKEGKIKDTAESSEVILRSSGSGKSPGRSVANPDTEARCDDAADLLFWELMQS